MANRLKYVIVIILLIHSRNLFAEKYWISFTDKSGVEFDPYAYFSQRTIDQRLSQGLNLCDEKDFPVNENYCSQVLLLSDSVSYSSRWLNGIAAYTSPDRIESIKALPLFLLFAK